MTFSSNVREEIAHAPLAASCCRIAYLAAVLRGAGSLHLTGGGHAHAEIDVGSHAVGRQILTALREVLETGAHAIDVKPAAHDAYVADVDERHARMVWTHKGLTNWYRNDAGRVFALLPYRLVDYWQMTKTFRAEDFKLA